MYAMRIKKEEIMKNETIMRLVNEIRQAEKKAKKLQGIDLIPLNLTIFENNAILIRALGKKEWEKIMKKRR